MSESQKVDLDGSSRAGSFPVSHHRSTGRTIVSACAVMVLVVAGLLIPVPFTGRAYEALGDLMHAPIFGGLAIGVLHLLQRFRPLPSIGSPFPVRYGLVCASVFAFGVAAEVVQESLGRSAAVGDVIANGLGIIAGALVYGAWQLKRCWPAGRWVSRTLWASAGFLLAIAWWAPLAKLRDVAAVELDFPLLASFESNAELGRFYFNRCEGRLTRRDATHGHHAMEICYQPTPYPAATMLELRSDWSEMKTLEMDVTLDASYSGESVRFMVKILDTTHDDHYSNTYRGQWALKPGQLEHILITREEVINGPDSSQIALSGIKYLELLVLDPGETTKIRVDAIRLTL